jgi:hypothetical protein
MKKKKQETRKKTYQKRLSGPNDHQQHCQVNEGSVDCLERSLFEAWIVE